MYVQGLQGNHTRYLRVSAACKHFAGYSMEKSDGTDRHHFVAHVDAEDWEETYTPVFEHCITHGKASGAMCSYNANLVAGLKGHHTAGAKGVPSCADPSLLRGGLLAQWQFDGYVTSDCEAVADVMLSHGFTNTTGATVAAVLRAGMDSECGSLFGKALLPALHRGDITRVDIDRAAHNLLAVQFRLGLFDPPGMVPWSSIGIERINTPQHQRLALEAARQGIVLLKNAPPPTKGANTAKKQPPKTKGAHSDTRRRRQPGSEHGAATLPLPLTARTLAVVGPNANATLVLQGNYQGVAPYLISPLAGTVPLRDKANISKDSS